MQLQSSEDFPFGPDIYVYKVAGKIFAILSETAGVARVNLKCDPQEALMLRDIFPAITPGYHMNKKHWISIASGTEITADLLQDLIQDSYADANKPFSELWNEEGFNFIYAPPGQKRLGSQKYILDSSDHQRLFTTTKPPIRTPPSSLIQRNILEQQKNKCNFSGSILKKKENINQNTYARDRVRLVWDHRIPVEKGGNSADDNFQALCFYCNKCKWQICNLCNYAPDKCSECVLAFPEVTKIIFPSQENIEDRLNRAN